jgi:hypothetical protein
MEIINATFQTYKGGSQRPLKGFMNGITAKVKCHDTRYRLMFAAF